MSHIIICIKNRDDKMEEILPGYAKLETNYEPENTMCWNCCHICDSVKYLPLKYKDSIFYVNGFFCSDECSFRYIYDTYKDKELWSKYQLMKFYHRVIYGEYTDIKLPPNRLALKSFGGFMDIEQYRHSNYNYELVIPPIVIVNNNEISEKRVKKDSEYLKLYRKKKEKNTILSTLKI